MLAFLLQTLLVNLSTKEKEPLNQEPRLSSIGKAASDCGEIMCKAPSFHVYGFLQESVEYAVAPLYVPGPEGRKGCH